MSSTALAVIPPAAHSLDERLTYAQHFAQAGMFTDVKTASQCLVKIQAGAELGFPPYASMAGIHIIEGKPTLGGNLYAALVDASPDHEIEVTEHSDKVAAGRFWKRSKRTGEWIVAGDFAFTWADAQRAGLAAKAVWIRNPRQMLYWRMVSNGARMYFASLCAGIYTPEELDAPIDEDGNYVAPPLPGPRTVRTVEAVVVEDALPADPEPASPIEERLRTHLLELIAIRSTDNKIKLAPKVVAEAIGIEVPACVSRIYKGKAKLLHAQMSTLELYRLARYTGAAEADVRPAEELEAELETMRATLSGTTTEETETQNPPAEGDS